ncbi:protein LKAAEAR1-like isoform X1 [Megalobrama amblycephala]|uniref:protein LKAAEAR1-like isoform X1 n=1 Tax=Megalobrama amblycephala TaxID=75352 RepID=UPI00201440AF|nr:protein LKAAEAR1-like isoform X1 [Megalobrama amblycephala]
MAGRKSRNSISVKMCPQQRARHEAYNEPSKETQRWMAEARQRVCMHLNHQKSRQVCNPNTAAERQNQLTAQLKAAEARNRVRQLRRHYQDLKEQEINLMISCQSNAQRAVRLEHLLTVRERKINHTDCMDQLQRRRVEEILEDEKGLTINRR